MTTLFLFGADYASPAALHSALKTLLKLPDYYGMNADALCDCLSAQPPIRLYVCGRGEGETAAALDRCMRVVRDCGGEAVLLGR